MFPRPARQRTTVPRVILAIALAFLAPPLIWAALTTVLGGAPPLSRALDAVLTLVAMSFYLGWIFVLPACIAWAVLHYVERHYVASAVVVGLTAGGVLGALLSGLGDPGADVWKVPPACAATGAVTGLVVWLAAYGWRAPAPKTIITRPPLVL